MLGKGWRGGNWCLERAGEGGLGLMLGWRRLGKLIALRWVGLWGGGVGKFDLDDGKRWWKEQMV